MKNILKMELTRGYKSKGLKLALLFGILMALLDVRAYYILDCEFQDVLGYTSIFMESFLGMDIQFVYRNLFRVLLPILSALPMGASYYQDKKTGYIKNLCMKTSKKSYHRAKYIATYFWGCVAIIIPLVVSLMISMALYPVLNPEPFAQQNLLTDARLMADLYYTSPLIYVIIYILINSLIGGIFAVISLSISNYMSSIFSVTVFPMVIYLVAETIFTDMFRLSELSPYCMTDAVQSNPSSGICIALFLVLGTVVTYWMFCVREARKDVL